MKTLQDDPLLPGHNRLAALAGDLSLRGWSLLEDWPAAPVISALADTAQIYEAEDHTRPAAIGSTERAVVDRDYRRARLRWLNGVVPSERAYLDAADALRLALNERLFLGLFDFEACFAIYPPGGFYRRHTDSFVGARNRIVSVVTYLNPHWNLEDGGELVIYGADGSVAMQVIPKAGLSVLMLSEEIEHEVLPTKSLRLAIAGWWRVNSADAHLKPI